MAIIITQAIRVHMDRYVARNLLKEVWGRESLPPAGSRAITITITMRYLYSAPYNNGQWR